MALGILPVVFFIWRSEIDQPSIPSGDKGRNRPESDTEYFCYWWFSDCLYYTFVYSFVTFGEKRDQAAGLAFIYYISI